MKVLFTTKRLLFLLGLTFLVNLNWAQTTTFNYTGNVQTYTVPPGVFCIQVDVRGAKGGGPQGGNGARVQATLNVTPGQVLEIRVGGQGTCPNGPNGNLGGGGWNGGGHGVGVSMGGQFPSCGGGGASDIRIAPYGLGNRIVVAAGGGGRNGASSQYLVAGGAGGCATGAAGQGSPFTGTGGTGGTQSVGGTGGPPWGGGGQTGQNGTLGQGGNGVSGINGAEAHGGGGGGGYYGGGGGGSDGCCNGSNGGGAGGGGSSLTPPGGTCTQGFNAGDGVVIITVANPITFNLTSNSPLCIGQTLNLNVSNIVGGNTPYTFSWTGPNGFTSNQQNPSITNINANQFGDYTVTVTSSNGCVTASATINVQVGQSANVTIVPDDTTICIGNSVVLMANADVPGGNFSWNTGTFGPLDTVAPIDTTTYTVSYNLNGCISTATATINVNQLPTPTITGDLGICLNESTTLTASGGDLYSWNTGANSQDITVSPTNNSIYTVTVTDVNGCISSTSATVEVFPLPDASFTSNQVCEGNPTTLTNTSTISSGTLTGTNWSVSPVISSGNNSVTHVFPSGGTFPVTLTVTSDRGCTSSVTEDVIVNYNPVVNISSNITEGCEPLCVNFYDQSTVTNASIINWSWKSNNQVISSDQNPNYCFSNDGQYSIQLDVISSLGCSSTQIYPGYITVFPTPVANFEPSSDSVPINSPTVLFVNLSQDGSLYQWDFGDGTVSNEFSPTHTYNSIGQFCIELLVTSSSGCTDVERKCIKVYGEHFVFIPNSFTPNGDELNEIFTVRGYGIQQVEMWIFDRWGRQLFYSNKADVGWDGTELNSTNPLPTGTYVYKIRITDYKNIEKDYFGFINLVR
jgi:gliding motility-associated-like protein